MSETITIIDIQADNTSLEAAVKSAKKLTSALEAAEQVNATGGASGNGGAEKQIADAKKVSSAQINADDKATASAISNDTARIVSSESLEAAEITALAKVLAAYKTAETVKLASINKLEGTTLSSAAKVTSAQITSDSKTAKSAEKTADREIDAVLKASRKRIAEIEKGLAAEEKARLKEVETAEKAAQKKARADEKAAQKKIEADEKATLKAINLALKQQAAEVKAMKAATAAAKKEADKQAAAGAKAAREAEAAHHKMHAQAIKENQRITASAEKEAKQQAKAAVDAAKSAARAATLYTTAVLGTAAAITHYSLEIAKAQKETKLLAGISKTSAEGFREIEYALKSVGVTGEQFADQAQDMFRNLGEYARDAAGPFEDVRQTLKLSEEDARAYAAALAAMSGEDALEDLTHAFEAAGVETYVANQAIDALASDMDRAADIFRDNSEAANELGIEYHILADAMKLTGDQADSFDDVSASVNRLGKNAELVGTKFTAWAINPILLATVDAINNSVRDVALAFDMYEEGSIGKAAAELEKLKDEAETLKGVLDSDLETSFMSDDRIAKTEARLAELKDLIASAQTELNNMSITPGGDSGADSGGKKKPTLISADEEQKEADRVFAVQQDLQLRSLALLEESASSGTAVAQATAAAEYQIALNSLDRQGLSEKELIAQKEMLNREYAKTRTDIEKDAIAETAKIQAEIAAETARAQAELVSDLTSMTTNMLSLAGEEAANAFRALDDLFKILSRFSWFNGSGGVFSTIGGWTGHSSSTGSSSSSSRSPGVSPSGNQSGQTDTIGSSIINHINVTVNGGGNPHEVRSAAESGVLSAMKAISFDAVVRSQKPGGALNQGLGLA